MIKIAINGFGRIGRLAFRQMFEMDDVEVEDDVEEEPVPAPAPKTEIPVKFVVSTHEGYYISKGKRANSMNDARVFDDYRYAAGIAKAKNGKVVMLSDAPRPVRKAPAPAPVAKEA